MQFIQLKLLFLLFVYLKTFLQLKKIKFFCSLLVSFSTEYKNIIIIYYSVKNFIFKKIFFFSLPLLIIIIIESLYKVLIFINYGRVVYIFPLFKIFFPIFNLLKILTIYYKCNIKCIIIIIILLNNLFFQLALKRTAVFSIFKQFRVMNKYIKFCNSVTDCING